MRTAKIFPMVLSGEFTPRTTFDVEVNVRDEGDHYAIDDYFAVTVFRDKQLIDGWQFDDEPELKEAIQRRAVAAMVKSQSRAHEKQVESSLRIKQEAD